MLPKSRRALVRRYGIKAMVAQLSQQDGAAWRYLHALLFIDELLAALREWFA